MVHTVNFWACTDMLRKVRTSPHTSSKLSSQEGKQSLCASLKLFEHIFTLIGSEEKPEYTSTELAEREVLSQILPKSTVKCCRVLRSSPRMAKQDLVLAELLGVWVHTSPLPKCLARGFACAEHSCLAWGAGGTCALSQMGFHMQHFTHSSAHFLQLLLLGSPRCDLVCWCSRPDCSTALFHPFASEEVIHLSQEI